MLKIYLNVKATLKQHWENINIKSIFEAINIKLCDTESDKLFVADFPIFPIFLLFFNSFSPSKIKIYYKLLIYGLFIKLWCFASTFFLLLLVLASQLYTHFFLPFYADLCYLCSRNINKLQRKRRTELFWIILYYLNYL